jgi:hypothetical protein
MTNVLELTSGVPPSYRGLELPNKFGQLPFHPADKSGEGHNLDVYRPNEAYFEFVDRLITYAASLGITLMFVPAWGRYVTGGLQGGPIIFDEDSARAYGTFLGSRYPFHPWILGGDTPRWWNPKALSWAIQGNDLETLELQDYGPVWEAMAAGIKSGEQEAITKLDDPRCKDYSTFMTYHTSQSQLKCRSRESPRRLDSDSHCFPSTRLVQKSSSSGSSERSIPGCRLALPRLRAIRTFRSWDGLGNVVPYK